MKFILYCLDNNFYMFYNLNNILNPKFKGLAMSEEKKIILTYEGLKNLEQELQELKARIITIENMLRNAEIINTQNDTDTVSIGNKIKVYDYEFEEELEYTLVGSAEADPFIGKISNESPLGSAILGHSTGDIVEFEAPDGNMKFKILEIN